MWDRDCVPCPVGNRDHRDRLDREMGSMREAETVGRLCQTPRRFAETPYNRECLRK
jgi:hypothetical protein